MSRLDPFWLQPKVSVTNLRPKALSKQGASVETILTTGTDEELVGQVLDGNTAVFELLMRRYNQRLYRVIRSILRDDAEAEDVLQDAYIRSFEHLDQITDRSRFAAWLTRIAMHEAFARLRRRRRFEQLPEEEEQGGRSMQQETAASSNPERDAARNEARRLLEAAIDHLPQPYRTVILLRDVEELSTEETAECLHITADNVKVRLHRAHALLRRELWRRTGAVHTAVFDFPATRCNRVVAAVMKRLGIPPATV